MTTLGPVLGYDAQRGTRLVETLDAWFAGGGRLKETGAALHIHPNTVSQRLDRVAGAARATTGASPPGRSTCSSRSACTGCPRA